MVKDAPMTTKSRLAGLSLVCAFTLGPVPLAAAESAKAGAGAATAPAPSKKAAAPTPVPTVTTLKGEMTCAKCGLHESAKCQNVLRVKDAAGKETKYYLQKNSVAESQHDKVCGGSAPATVTGTVSDESGKKILTATSVKYD